MNSLKVERTAKCLQAIALIYAVQTIYINLKLVALSGSLSQFTEGLGAGVSASSIAGLNSGMMGAAIVSMAWAAALTVAAFVVSRELKAGKGWAWVAGLTVCVFTLPTFCLPASILGLLTLLDRDVREPYLATFEFKF